MNHRLPHEPGAARIARGLAADLARGRLSEPRAGEFVLIVSELVSNAVRHAPPKGDGSVLLRLETEDARLRAVVVDGGTELAFERATFDRSHPGHFGLSLVDALADHWGLSFEGSKAVWLEVGTTDRS